jgi:hypothetical protein
MNGVTRELSCSGAYQAIGGDSMFRRHSKRFLTRGVSPAISAVRKPNKEG